MAKPKRSTPAPPVDSEFDADWDSLDIDRILKRSQTAPAEGSRSVRDKYKSLLEISKRLAATKVLDELLVRILDTALTVTRMQKGVLMLRDGDGRFRVQLARGSRGQDLAEHEVMVSRNVVREVVRTGRPIYIADIEKSVLAAGAGPGQRAMVCFPLTAVAGSRELQPRSPEEAEALTIGLIYVESPLSSAEFPVVDLEFIEALAGQAAVAIENVRMYEEINRDRLVLADENRHLRSEVLGKYAFENMVGQSAKMRALYDLVARVGRSSVNVMIRGESGTGKELVAKTVHYNSDRAKQPFVSINCAALPESLLESELFGIEKGVATGVSKRIGKFEMADGGTFFLDEIGDMSLPIQAKVLRAIETHEIERVGGKVPSKVDVRIVAATNRDLEACIRDGSFREDLYFRLNVVPVVLPPLRDRREDIPELIEHFIRKHAGAMSKRLEGVSRAALDALMSHGWPGNVRELENVIQRAILMCDVSVIDIDHLPSELLERRVALIDRASTGDWTAEQLVREYARAVLARNKGNLTRTARVLGMDFKTLKKKLQ